jgi:hypothetical protein
LKQETILRNVAILVIDQINIYSSREYDWLQAGHPRKCGSIPHRGKIFTQSSKHPDWLWDPPGGTFTDSKVAGL